MRTVGFFNCLMAKKKKKIKEWKPTKLIQRYNVLNRAIDEKWLTTYTYFCYTFKDCSRFFHNGKYKEFAKLWKCSPQTASFHVKKMVEVGLCKWNGNQLQRLKQKTKSKKSFVVYESTLQRMKDFLESRLLVRNLRQQQYRIDKQKAIMSSRRKICKGIPVSKREIKFSRQSLSRSFCEETVLSGYRYANMLNRHYITAYRKLKKYVEYGWIKIEKRYNDVSAESYIQSLILKEHKIVPISSYYISPFRTIRIQRVSHIAYLKDSK